MIFIGGRLSGSYDALSEIAPVVYLSTDTELGVVESVRKNASTVASMFGLEAEVEGLMADFETRIQTLADFAEGKNGNCRHGYQRQLQRPGKSMGAALSLAWKSVLKILA